MVNLSDVIQNPEVEALIEGAQFQLNELGFTEHSYRHISTVSKRAGDILAVLGYNQRDVELAKIAGYLHDIGNSVNRNDHAHTGGILAFQILKGMDMELSEVTRIMAAIGNHDEKTGAPVNEISAALILADKSDVHRDRVMNNDFATFDIHDRVNYAVTNTELKVDEKDRKIILSLDVDTKNCPVIDYFQIFMDRTIMSKRAAKYLDIWFELEINGTKLL